jgi:hypothetical protein
MQLLRSLRFYPQRHRQRQVLKNGVDTPVVNCQLNSVPDLRSRRCTGVGVGLIPKFLMQHPALWYMLDGIFVFEAGYQ